MVYTWLGGEKKNLIKRKSFSKSDFIYVHRKHTALYIFKMFLEKLNINTNKCIIHYQQNTYYIQQHVIVKQFLAICEI